MAATGVWQQCHEVASEFPRTSSCYFEDVGSCDHGTMDPMLVLPTELLHILCARLPPADLTTLGQLNRAWRSFARDPSLWRRITLNVISPEPSDDAEPTETEPEAQGAVGGEAAAAAAPPATPGAVESISLLLTFDITAANPGGAGGNTAAQEEMEAGGSSTAEPDQQQQEEEEESDGEVDYPDNGIVAEEAPQAARVLGAAPCLRTLRLYLRRFGPFIKRAMLETRTTVTSLYLANFMPDCEDVRAVVLRLAPTLEELRLAQVRSHTLHLLSSVPLPCLSSLHVESVMDFDRSGANSDNLLRQLVELVWASANPSHYHDTAKPLIALLASVRTTLRELALGDLNEWRAAYEMKQVMAAVAECSGLRWLRTVCCGGSLRLAWPLAELRAVSLVLAAHHELTEVGADDAALRSHRECMAALPPSIEELTVWVVDLGASCEAVVALLLREAPRLAALRRLEVRWCILAEDADESAELLAAGLPGVEVRSVGLLGLADKESPAWWPRNAYWVPRVLEPGLQARP